MDKLMLCPCGSHLLFTDCCQPYIAQKKYPATPEILMRSRFSAYATKNGQYIFDTYAKSQQLQQSVNEIQDWADEAIWLALKIHHSENQYVEFSAYYLVNNILCELRENSTFIIEGTQWRYTSGDIIKHVEMKNITRNMLCPCNHYSTAWTKQKGKKFKQCCGK